MCACVCMCVRECVILCVCSMVKGGTERRLVGHTAGGGTERLLWGGVGRCQNHRDPSETDREPHSGCV